MNDLLDRLVGPSSTSEAPVGAVSLTGALPDDFDASRQYVIPGCTTVELERYVHPCGPANPMSRTLADVVKAWAG